MDVTIGGFDGILPFGREIERYVMEGNLFSILTCCHTRYRETVEHTLDDLLEGEWKNDGKKRDFLENRKNGRLGEQQ